MLKRFENIIPGRQKRKILIVDDEPINRELLGNILEEKYDILYASTGSEAIEMIHKNRDTLSLVLLDLLMPEMNGMDALVQIKNEPEISPIPVIVLTSEKDAEVESLSVGAIDFIPKPYPKPEVILARVQRTIELYEGWDIIRWTEYDSLTGLYNREYFYRYAEQFDLHSDASMDAIVININHFHILNERYGKRFGDEVLKRIGKKVEEIVRDDNGFACRPEADNFLIYCHHHPEYNAMLEHVAASLLDKTKSDNRIRLRMGVYPDVDKNLDIERRFDRAKLAADSIRGSFVKSIAVYDNALHEIEIFEDLLLSSFEDALREGQFQVYYQPKFDIRPQNPILASAEALVRWQHPERGMISPGVFIPLFERHGLIRDLDAYVWRQAAFQMKDWKERLGFTVPISVNVSRIDMYDTDLVQHLQDLLEETGLSGEDIFLEITESAYTQDSEQIIETVHRMRSIGLRVEMDDFGTGYSSLNMVSNLPIDALKLDLQFIRNAFGGRKNTRMLEVILDIAETLNVPTIAEGVETAEQMMTLRAMGCDYAQGYYFSRPVPPEEYEKFLIERKEIDVDANASPEKIERVRRDKERDYEKMTYDSLHDPLTGLYNHTAYDLLFRDANQNHLALMIAVVDDYKYVNDMYGQEVADNAIRKIADVLRANYRSVDHICRISKDEFVVMVSRVNSEQKETIAEKIVRINETLKNPGDNIPPLSLSVGLAFSDRENPQGDIFQDADSALKQLKEERGKGYKMY